MDKNKVEYYLKKDHKSELAAARERVSAAIKPTPLIYSDFYSAEHSCDVYLKPENLQTTGSFKIRGAYNKIAALGDSEIKRGIISASAGNHAQGVAFSAGQRRVPATIVMPNITPLIKVDATKAYGANILLHGDVYDESYNKAVEMAEQNDMTFIHPFDDYDVLVGQGTIGAEIIGELPDADEILVPIGGGGLIAGLLLSVKSLAPNIKVVGVIPEGAQSIVKSLEAGHAVRSDKIQTCAEGVAVKQPGDLTFAIIQEYVDDIITVSEKDIMENILLMMEKHKLIAETAGVVTLAGIKKRAEKGKKIVCLISGGNIDTVTISSIVNQGMISRGRIMCFSVELPDKPGQLVQVATLLAKEGANVIELVHNQFKALDRWTDKVALEVTVETNGVNHIDKVLATLAAENFIVRRIY